jgi:hypothetical protein
MFEYRAYNDDPDTTFLDDLCQDIETFPFSDQLLDGRYSGRGKTAKRPDESVRRKTVAIENECRLAFTGDRKDKFITNAVPCNLWSM